MDDFIAAIALNELPDGSMKTVVVRGKSLAMGNVGGDIFAMDDICSHEHCSLGTEGFLDAGVITCGCHGGQFDTTNGKVLALPPTQDLRTYETKVENNQILVKL